MNPDLQIRGTTYLGEASLSALDLGWQYCQVVHLIQKLACPSFLVNDLQLLGKVLAVSIIQFKGFRHHSYDRLRLIIDRNANTTYLKSMVAVLAQFRWQKCLL